MKCNKILVALSGGVDSSVCVHLMKEQGHDVTGLVLHLSPAHNSTVEAAQAAADAMGIPLIVAQEEEWFQREVVTPWAEAYRRGQTPNPCILCNPSTKFALLCRRGKSEGIRHHRHRPLCWNRGAGRPISVKKGKISAPGSVLYALPPQPGAVIHAVSATRGDG